MKELIVAAVLLSSVLGAQSCSGGKSVAAQYLASQKAGASGDAAADNSLSTGDDNAAADDQSTGDTGDNSVVADEGGATPTEPVATTPKPNPATPTPTTPTPTTPAPAPAPTPAADPKLALTYANVAEQVLVPACTSCHGAMGGVNLETYTKVKGFAAAVKTSVSSGKMPEGGLTLTAAQKDLLLKWITAGTPEK